MAATIIFSQTDSPTAPSAGQSAISFPATTTNQLKWVDGDGGTMILQGTASKTLTFSNSLTLAGTDGKILTLTNSLTVSGNDGTISFGAASKTLTVNDSATIDGTGTLTLTGNLTVGATTSITGGGTVALGGFTATIPATGTVALATGIAAGQTIYGGTASGDDLTLESTSNATKGYVLLNPNGGNVGIKTTSPSLALDVSDGSASGCLQMGADVNAITRSVNTRKIGRFVMPNYDGAGNPISLFAGDADGTNNIVDFGGIQSSSSVYAATLVRFLTGVNDTTNGGSIRMVINGSGNVEIGNNNGATAINAKLKLDQFSATGAIPVLTLNQADVSEEFIRLIGTSTTDATQSLVDAADMTTPGSIQGWIRIYIQDDQGTGGIADGIYFLPFYSAPTA